METITVFDEHNSLSTKRVDIRFCNISYSVPNQNNSKEILRSVSGEFKSGELSAIIGSSGAGKTTLMNILAGSINTKVEGKILINNVERDLKTFRKMSCYIMQFDALCPLLSVTEVMQFAAHLKIGNEEPTDGSNSSQEIINDILETMTLSQFGDTRISNLSSGEKKRLTIALELIHNPPILFFDEPTTGLDSSSCIQCVSVMKKLAKSGRTVICVIHQPSSFVFSMFDRLYLLAEGQCIYQGPTGTGLVNYFTRSIGITCPEDYNLADFAIDVAVGKYGQEVDKLAETMSSISLVPDGNEVNTALNMENECSVNHQDDNQADITTSFWIQFKCLFKRSLLCTLRDLSLTRARLVINISCALLVGSLFFSKGNEGSMARNNVSLLFFLNIIVVFSAKMATVLTFPLERPIIAREHLNNWYTLKTYFLAKSAADFPFEVIYPSIFLTITYLMTGQPWDFSRFIMFWSTGVVTSLVAQSVGLAIGIAFSLEMGALMCMVTIAFSILFCGFLIPVRMMPLYIRWMSSTVYLKYSIGAICISIYGLERGRFDCSEPYCIYRSPTSILEEFGIQESDYWTDMVILIGLFLLARLVAYFFLRKKIRI